MANDHTTFWQDLVRVTERFDPQHIIASATIAATAVEDPPRLKVRAVLTDYDGVIGDNDTVIREAYAKLQATKLGKELPDFEKALPYKHDPRGFLKQEMGELTKAQRLELLHEGSDIYKATKMNFMPDAQETIRLYDKKQIPWAVVSNNGNTKMRWQQMGLAESHPDTFVLDHAKKPSLAGLEKALEVMNEPAGKDVIMVDDGWKGLVAAAKLGVTPVYIGEKAHIELPKVQHALQQEGYDMPDIPVVKNNRELQELVANGLQLGTPAISRQL